MLHTRILNGTIELDGRKYHWDLRREPQWCTVDGWQGMLIGVRDANEGGREALLQFPRPKGTAQRARGPRHRPQVHRGELEQAINAALAAGWEPAARGKPFHFEV
jgi:hypothetical protein